MPNPKSGTVTADVGKAVGDIKAGRVEYRTDKSGNLHLVIGKRSFSEDDLVANYVAVLDEVQRAKPAASKGRYLRAITLAPTMGPGIRIDPAKSKELDEELAGASS
jgi:large subunit ribosomal protein L1